MSDEKKEAVRSLLADMDRSSARSVLHSLWLESTRDPTAAPARIDGDRVSDGREWFTMEALRETFDGDGDLVRPLLDGVCALQSSLATMREERDEHALAVIRVSNERDDLTAARDAALADVERLTKERDAHAVHRRRLADDLGALADGKEVTTHLAEVIRKKLTAQDEELARLRPVAAYVAGLSTQYTIALREHRNRPDRSSSITVPLPLAIVQNAVDAVNALTAPEAKGECAACGGSGENMRAFAESCGVCGGTGDPAPPKGSGT